MVPVEPPSATRWSAICRCHAMRHGPCSPRPPQMVTSTELTQLQLRVSEYARLGGFDTPQDMMGECVLGGLCAMWMAC